MATIQRPKEQDWCCGRLGCVEPLEQVKADGIVTVAKYAQEKDLTKKPLWKWAAKYRKHPNNTVFHSIKIKAIAKRKAGPNYEFGFQLPISGVNAYKLDRLNGNTAWKEAIKEELDKLNQLSVFITLEKGPSDYQKIPLRVTFNVKSDGRRKARLVAGGH